MHACEQPGQKNTEHSNLALVFNFLIIQGFSITVCMSSRAVLYSALVVSDPKARSRTFFLRELSSPQRRKIAVPAVYFRSQPANFFFYNL